MDKTESEDKNFSGNVPEHGNDAGLDCHVLLLTAGVHQVSDKIPFLNILSAQDSAGNADGEDFAYRFAEFKRDKACQAALSRAGVVVVCAGQAAGDGCPGCGRPVGFRRPNTAV
ncbi:MAG: hypothetical protein HY796_07740 [Elusimicrobia bacterium]|nr:hypothetical protein [Elusimicrobiota bacterium]